MNIETLIRQPESVTLEIKKTVPSPDGFAKLLVAFSNQKGGTIVLGVTDAEREIVGIDPDFLLEEWVMNIASTNCHPAIFPVVEFHTVKEKIIGVIKVYQGRLKPYFVKKKGEEKGVFIRIGSTIRLADRNLIRHLSREAMHIPYDHLEVIDQRIDGISEKEVQDFFFYTQGKKNKFDKTSVYLNIGIAKKKNGDLFPTIGGLLLFGRDPQAVSSLSCASVKIGRFAGNDVTSPVIDQMLIEGDIRNQIETAELFFKRNLSCMEQMEGFRRMDLYEYPLEVLRELTINAIVHRDYFLAAKENIKICVFNDRIEFYSPGLLPEDVTVDNIYDRQVSRNPMLARVLFRWGYMEAWGKGLDTVKKVLSDRGFPPLLLIEGDKFVKAVVFRPKSNKQ